MRTTCLLRGHAPRNSVREKDVVNLEEERVQPNDVGWVARLLWLLVQRMGAGISRSLLIISDGSRGSVLNALKAVF